MPSDRSRLEAELAAARAAMRLLRDEPTTGGTEKRAALLLPARRRVAEAERALRALSAPAGPAEPGTLRRVGDDVEGLVRVLLPPGLVRADRARLVGKAVGDVLAPLLAERDVTLSAAGDRYVRERGRDDEGRTLLELRARIEGDFLVPVKVPAPQHRDRGGDEGPKAPVPKRKSQGRRPGSKAPGKRRK